MMTPRDKSAEWHGIARAYGMMAQEVGHVMAAITIYNEILATQGPEMAWHVLKQHGRTLPVLSALIVDGKSSEQIRKRIHDLTNNLAPILHNKQVIVCVGAEAAWLDCATQVYPDKQFYIIRHAQDANIERFLVNYASNKVYVYENSDLTPLAGTGSVIIVFAFNIGFATFHTYPIACRIIGSDTRQSFADIIALDLLDCTIPYFPYDFVEIGFDEVTQIVSRRQQNRRALQWTSQALA
jgi:hypothetical protein